MTNEIDFDALFNKYKADPFVYVDVFAVHTGRVSLRVVEGEEVRGAGGKWLQIPGSGLYEINRERNPKLITAPTNGTVEQVRTEFDGQFVEAGEKLMIIKHPLKKKDIIENLLKEVLFLFSAPETARYYFSTDIQSSIDKRGARAVTIDQGEEILTMSLMKRDTPVYYHGQSGVIHSVYFNPGISVVRGQPLIGVCAPEKLSLIEKIITRVKADWDSTREI